MYKIELSKRAIKDLKKLTKSVFKKISIKIDKLSKNPCPQNAKKLISKDDFFRIRPGDYRIIYQIKDSVLLILVVKIGHRKDIYKILR
jgi:mRNA interferase RelE/StbE